LLGLKENVIIGKLVPAGTGMDRYRNLNILSTHDDKDESTSEEAVLEEVGTRE
jgi:DNA-directed RNA polymerase subunit beta'